MSAHDRSGGPGPGVRRASPGRHHLGRYWRRTIRRLHESGGGVLLLLVLFGTACAAALPAVDAIPVGLLVVPMVLGSALLGPRFVPWFIGYLLVLLVVVLALQQRDPEGVPPARWFGTSIDVLIATVIIAVGIRRSRLGVAALRGESMLVDLRDRIVKQGEIPVLPSDWDAQAVLRSAGGSAFAGDFFVAARTPDHRLLNLAVVDVSGKGEQAGTRSLLLSGAFSGLLGALPPEDFLTAANRYLLAQDWREGFATAIHLVLDLGNGAFELRSAGHPPAVQRHAGSGRWVVHDTVGPVLGLIPEADFEPVVGRMGRGDALMLYTDGLVETPVRDLAVGIDRLVGEGERLFQSGFENGARRVIDRLRSRTDDCALLLVHRRERWSR